MGSHRLDQRPTRRAEFGADEQWARELASMRAPSTRARRFEERGRRGRHRVDGTGGDWDRHREQAC